MKDLLKSRIKSIEPEFTDTSENIARMSIPNQVLIYSDEIDITLTDAILEATIYDGEDKVELSDEDINWIYKYAEQLLTDQTELAKQYYEASIYEDEQLSWFIR